MTELRHFGPEDAAVLHENLYTDMDIPEIKDMIEEWNTFSFKGRYFEMFAVVDEGRIAGHVSLYEHSPICASIGPDIFPSERRKGFAFSAMKAVLEKAAEKGYRIILQQVRTNNTASIRLHEKLGFETDGYVYKNRKDHDIVLYLKAL